MVESAWTALGELPVKKGRDSGERKFKSLTDAAESEERTYVCGRPDVLEVINLVARFG